MAEIPEHLRHIIFQPWHFYGMKNKQTGKMVYTLNDNFTDEVMQQLGLIHTASVEVHKDGENGRLILASVIVYNKNDTTIQTPGFASVTRMPRDDGGQTHFAQLAVTRALSAAVQRHLGISNHDVEIISQVLGLTPTSVQTRETSMNDEVTEAPVIENDVTLELDI